MVNYLWDIWVVLLGLVMGSFASVLVERLPRDQSIVKPGSRCPKCSAKLKLYDNIPVVGYLWLRGRCRQCRAPISPRYLVLEVLMALLFYAFYTRYGFGVELLIRHFVLVTILIAITFIDLEHRIIPNELSLGGLGWALASSFIATDLTPLEAVIGAAIGYGFFAGTAWFYKWRTGRVGLGGGDVKLLACLGAYLGPEGVFTTIFVSSITGSLVGLVLGVTNKDRGFMKVAIPYGPFLILGALVHLLFGINWGIFNP